MLCVKCVCPLVAAKMTTVTSSPFILVLVHGHWFSSKQLPESHMNSTFSIPRVDALQTIDIYGQTVLKLCCVRLCLRRYANSKAFQLRSRCLIILPLQMRGCGREVASLSGGHTAESQAQNSGPDTLPPSSKLSDSLLSDPKGLTTHLIHTRQTSNQGRITRSQAKLTPLFMEIASQAGYS